MDLALNLTAKEALMLMLPSQRSPLDEQTADLSLPSTMVKESTATHTPLNASGFSDGSNGTGLNETNNNGSDWFNRNEDLQRIEIAVSATILYLALFGNGVVLLILWLRRQKLTRMQWFIAHLAFADLFVAIFNILPQLIWDITVEFHGNDFICRSVKYFQVVAMYVSSYVLVMAAIDRYLSICHPLTSQTLSPKRVHLMIALAWILSLACALPQVFIFSLKDFGEGSYECHGEFVPGWGLKAYVTYVFVADYAIPFLILAFCYGRICHVVWASVGSKESSLYIPVRNGHQDSSNKRFKMRISFRSMRDSHNSSVSSRERPEGSSMIMSPSAASQKPRGHQRGVSRSKMRTVKLTLTVVLCYMFCWAPFFVVQMWTAFDETAAIEHPIIVIIFLLASLNSCTNPWIYLAFSGRSCPRGPLGRRASRNWVPSTHLTSAADSNETKSRASLIDLSHARVSSRHSSPLVPDRKNHHNSKC